MLHNEINKLIQERKMNEKKISKYIESTINSCIIGNITKSMRMINISISHERKRVYVIVYFDKIPCEYEQEIVFDISGEIEAHIIFYAGYTCESKIIVSDKPVWNQKVKNFEKKLLENEHISVSFLGYLRFGEGEEYLDLTSSSYEKISNSFYHVIDD